MIKIKQIIAREILDSRGNPTVETKVILSNNLLAKASVPSGASTGEHEAVELRDSNPKRYHGKGVLLAVSHVNNIIAPRLKGFDVLKQKEIDKIMIALDGTENKKKLGANAILSVSLACARVAALAKKQELYIYLAKTYGYKFKKYSLPTPAFNLVNGGAHAASNLDFQEFMVIPKISGKVSEKIRLGSEVFHQLGKIISAQGMPTNVGNEGGYAFNVKYREQVIEFLLQAISESGYNPKKDVGLGLDVGSSEFYNPDTKQYELALDNQKLDYKQMITLYKDWVKRYPIISIEDGLAENDWEGWQVLNKELGKKTLLIGDDLFTTNIKRLKMGIEKQAANAILIKLNQIGTLTETIETVKLAQKSGYAIMISHRSGETGDDFIADLAVAVGAEYIKAGSLSRSERLAKYNRLMEIEIGLK